MATTGILDLTNHCPACGAEEGLDGLIARMIDDDDARRLIADVLTMSLPLGGLVVRYMRLHKPVKQRLRMRRAAELLGELVPAIQAGVIDRKGREWPAPIETWKAALDAVFVAQHAGRLVLPLADNGYLFEIVMRMSDQQEGRAEAAREQQRRSRVKAGGTGVPEHAADVLRPAPVPPPIALPTEKGPSSCARKLRAEIDAIKARRGVTTEDAHAVDKTAGINPTIPTSTPTEGSTHV